jgi:putative ATPase
LPEAQYHLAHATVYLATAPKSNSMCDYFKALECVEKEGKTEVPIHLRSKMKQGICEGHKVGYKYPHSYPNHWVEQNYLPENLKGVKFYTPQDQGYEKKIIERIKFWESLKK